MDKKNKHLLKAIGLIVDVMDEKLSINSLDVVVDELAKVKADAVVDLPVVDVPVIDNSEKSWEALLKYYASYTDIGDHFKVASLAQWILESGRGTSELSLKHVNFGGLKWRDEMKSFAQPVAIKVPSERDVQQFCKFEDVESFVRGYWVFIERKPYVGWKNKNSAEEYIDHIAKAGYAADPSYAKKVKSLFNEARKTLNRYGADIGEERPTSPIVDKKYEIPIFKELPGDIKFDNQGKYKTPTGYAKGLIIHYPVGINPIGVARYMASQGYGCMCMGRDGVIWVPKGWDWRTQWDDHAGKSAWQGETWLSSKYYGLEVSSWGRLSSKTKNYVEDNEIRFSDDDENIIEGEYHIFSPEQEAALVNFCLWQDDVNPEFSLDRVIGHDEARDAYGLKGDKTDPGASLSMTMPDFRKKLIQILE